MKPSSIAIIGIGSHYPGASDLKELWENILSRRRQFREMPKQRLPLDEYYDRRTDAPDKTYGRFAAVIDGFSFDWAQRRIPKATYEGSDIVHWLALEVASQALADAGYTRDKIPKDKTGVIVGNTLTGEFTRANTLRLRWPYVRKTLRAAGKSQGLSDAMIKQLEQQMESIYKSAFPPVTEDTLAGGLSNTIAGRICNYYDLHGGGYVVDGACSSSLLAVATAAGKLANGELDLALAGGVDISLDPLEVVGFAKAGALTKNDMNVYDRQSSGFIPGEGCGFIMMKRLEDAKRDGDYIYAVIQGWGISSDGKGGITAPKAEGQALALLRAYEMAGYSPHELDFIEGHGTGTVLGDRIELQAINQARAAYGEPQARSCGVTSFKSLVGHTKAAAGIGGLIKAVLCVNQRVLAPTAACHEPNDIFQTTAQSIYPILQGEIRAPEERLRAGVSAMGFGGINCHVTLESADLPKPELKPELDERALLVSNQDTELFVFAADNKEDLLAQIKETQQLAAGISIAELADLAHLLAERVKPKAKVRAALIADHPDRLAEKLAFVSDKLEQAFPAKGEVFTDMDKQVWISNQVSRHRVGFLFPGQGSQKLNMARLLVERFPWAREIAERAWEAAPKAQKKMFRPLDRARDREELNTWSKELSQTEVAQPAICLASTLWRTFLEKLGIQPQFTAGHSLGELTALHTAGAYDEATLFRLAAARGKAMSAPAEEAGTMASLRCNRQEAEALLADVPGYVVIANLNSPSQTVISGEKEAVAEVVARAQARQIQAIPLSVSNAFHSKLVEQASLSLRKQAPLPAEPVALAVPFISGIDGERMDTLADGNDYFAKQIVEKVNFVSLLSTVKNQCDLLVEVGPGRVLTGLVAESSINLPCFPVESAPGMLQDLHRFLAAYFTHGGDVQWTWLYANRLIRPFVPAAEKAFIVNPCENPLTIPESPFSGTATVSLPEPSDLPPGVWERYLEERGAFLYDVIQADLKHMRLTPSSGQQTGHAPTPSIVRPTPTSTEPTAPSTNAPSVTQAAIQLAAKQTGYPAASITLNHRLLDDLNLDSIKSAEFVSSLAQQFAVADKIDPGDFANATLAEVCQALEMHIAPVANQTGQPDISQTLLQLAAQLTGYPADSIRMDMRLLDDLNLDSIKSAELVSSLGQQFAVADKIDPSDFANATLAEVCHALEMHIAPAANRNRLPNVSETVLQLAAQLTGYPADSIHMNMRLLDDLNLDSIKSAELVSSLAQQFAVADKLDPSDFANATLAEVCQALEPHVASSGQVIEKIDAAHSLLRWAAQLTGYPADSIDMDMRLLDDLNLDSIKSAELVSHVAKEMGVEEKVDPSDFANATLREIEQALTPAPVQQPVVAPVPAPVQSEHGERAWVRNFVINYVEAPRHSSAPLSFPETTRFLLVAEPSEQAWAQALVAELSSHQIPVELSTLAELSAQKQARQEEISHAVVILPQADDKEELTEMVKRLQCVITPGNGLSYRTSISYIQFGGGLFGSGTEPIQLATCTANSFAASLHMERPNAAIRVIDLSPALSPVNMAKPILEEIMAAETFVSVGYDQNEIRRVPQSVVQQPQTYPARAISWTGEDVVLVTGGAKGITAECALAVARTTGVKMALVGRSGADHPDVRRTLARFQEAGLICRYYACDMADQAAVELLINRVREELGQVTGVIHGAALMKPRRAEQITLAGFMEEIGPKVLGAFNLVKALQDQPPKLFVGISSLAGVTGMAGNTSYGFSNEALQLILRRFGMEHPETEVLSVAFSVWDEVGMGVRAGSIDFLEKKGTYAIPVAEGVGRFVHLFLHDPAAKQVIITAKLGGLDTWHPRPVPRERSYRYIGDILYDHPEVELITRVRLTLEQDSYVKDHVYNGTYLFPAVFGLEAMAQAVSYVTGIVDFSHAQIEDIRFSLPITLDPHTGALIEIRAEVLEDGRVKTEIRTEKNGFTKPYFTATFAFPAERETITEPITFPAQALPIDPKTDLYGPLLFQGPSFHRLADVYEASHDPEQKTGHCLFTAQTGEGEYVLGDPYFHDALLQSARIITPQDLCLPVKIDSFQHLGQGLAGSGIRRAVTKLQQQTDTSYTYMVDVLDEHNRVIQRLNGYQVHLMERFPELPTANELCSPAYIDEQRLAKAIQSHAHTLEVDVPVITLTHCPGIHQQPREMRHEKLLPLYQRAIALAGGDETYPLTWDENGKPHVTGQNGSAVRFHVSFSHDDEISICTVGQGEQGCDILPIDDKRGEEEWHRLLTSNHHPLLQALVAHGDSVSLAGSRIWSAREAAEKASGEKVRQFEIGQRADGAVLLRAITDTAELTVLTLPVQLSLPVKRMVAVVIVCQREEKDTTPSFGEFHPEHGFVYRFPLTFKDAATLSRKVSLTRFAEWMGKVRELSLSTVQSRITEQFASGKWGMVTNFAQTEIVGEASSDDVIEVHLQIDHIQDNQYMELVYYWYKVSPNGALDLIATSRQGLTWVEIIGHGVVRPAPFPDYYAQFLREKLTVMGHNGPVTRTETPLSKELLGPVVFTAPSGPANRWVLQTGTFETCLEESNLVGNVYFSNYTVWQNRVRDRFFHSLAPELFQGTGEHGEWVPLNNKVHHLREAMPFDTIEVHMSLVKRYQSGLSLFFEYYRLDENGQRHKLAYGEQEIAWMTRDELGNPQPAPIPEAFDEALSQKPVGVLS
ncbi:acyl transferase domain-containing protein [Laceyella sacchari]|uniref:type I polyketide synthase n=1 Tax=Laceyella sacchari TaxID=37482 RepID=UPI00104A3D48|nr:type I polyketide synthase [Laceyella sacchari]TCW40538.1 acyl transferase domain-containing protein [Laceyella sacchari]